MPKIYLLMGLETSHYFVLRPNFPDRVVEMFTHSTHQSGEALFVRNLRIEENSDGPVSERESIN